MGGGFPQTAQDTKSGAGQYFTPPAEIAREIIEDLEAALEQFRLIDAPLGWPAAYAAALIDHFAGAALNGPKNALFRRRTDESVQRRIGKTPLEVGADRIARASFSALEALELLRQFAQRPIPLAWAADSLEGIATIEVYPAATLKVRGIVEPGYKKPCNTEARSRISLALTPEIVGLGERVAAQDDEFDACLCLLAARDLLDGTAVGPRLDESALAVKEGWIWVRSN